MKAERRVRSIVGFVIAVMVTVFVLVIFFMLGKTEIHEKYLADRKSCQFGWSYEILSEGKVMAVTPEFSDEFNMSFPVENIEAVKIERIFTEDLPWADLQMQPFNEGVEVFLDGRLLYSDFQKDDRNEEGFLLLDEEEKAGFDESVRTIRISLPENYTGKTLSLITYFKKTDEYHTVVFPLLCNYQTFCAPIVTDSVIPIAILTVCGILTILLAVIFWLDLSNAPGDKRILWMVLFSLLLFLDRVYGAGLGDYSVLSAYLNLSFLPELYMAPLILYLVSLLKGRKKYLMSGLTIVWFFYELIVMFYNFQNDLLIGTNRTGIDTLILLLVMMALVGIDYFCSPNWRESFRWYYIVLAVVVSGICIRVGAREWDGDVGYYLQQVIHCVQRRNCFPAVTLLTNICAIMVVILLVVNFIERTWKTKAMVSVLEESSRLTLEGYNRMIEAELATRAARHEMRHHMTALIGMLKEEEIERAKEYILAIDKELLELPTMRYSHNILVNAIAGAYLDKAKKLGIEVMYRFEVPEKLNIADEDLCVFLTNMLENAVEACERMPKEKKRYIRVTIRKEEDFLFIGCINSMSNVNVSVKKGMETTKKDRHKHGYGLAAMKRIAKKNNGVFNIEYSETEFSVKSNLCLYSANGRPESEV